jgi:succinate-semialdehyde dehydrogenase/glutarate-semialdehyde dehydrogenase
MEMKAINPLNGKEVKSYPAMEQSAINSAIENCHAAYQKWKRIPLSERARHMKAAARILTENATHYAELMAVEMGKPVREGLAEAEKCAWVCEYYADNAHTFLKTEHVPTNASESFVAFQPLGVILAIMPWNFPFWQVFRFAVPALMAGNTTVLKHSSNVPGCALAIQDVFKEAGFPEHAFKTILINSKQITPIIENPLIQAVTLTGSTQAGKEVARKAGAVLKKIVLELGGSDPYIILDDAEMEETVKSCVQSRLINSGQSCIAAKRFIITENIRREFESLFVEHMKTYKMGDPFDKEVRIGPLARFDLRDDLHRQVRESIDRGARCLLGGQIPENRGAFYPATVLTHVEPGMPAYEEELFGPVAAIIPAKNEKDAVRIANDSSFGLGAALFTQNLEKGRQLAEHEIEAGNCFLNTFVRSDPRLPFGGIKQSGYGRELSVFGIREFVNIKTIYIK